ncbi:MAG: hypothetical protein AB1472_00490 [Candidatus Omnitrophota bacterium]
MEYGILITAIATALLVMQVYVKRGIQGKIRQTSDNISEQYAPGKTSSDRQMTLTSSVVTKTTLEDKVIIDDDGQEKKVKVTIINTDTDEPEKSLEQSDEKTPNLEDNLFE